MANVDFNGIYGAFRDGARKVSEAVGDAADSAQRDERRRQRDRAESRQARVEAKLGRQRKADFDRGHVGYGGRRMKKDVDKLKRDILHANASFVTYPTDMAKWTDKALAAKLAEEHAGEYTRHMYSLCLSPLNDGVSGTSVMECLGMYIGMAVTSPVFRKDANKQILKALTPIAEGAAKMNCTMANWLEGAGNAAMDMAEKVSGRKLPGHDARQDYVKHDWRDHVFARAVRDQYMKTANDGRLPLTPESAAVQQLGFVVSAYEAMRQPGADMDKIQRDFAAANKSLYAIAEMDGIGKEQLDRNVRTMAGKLMDKYPDFKYMFAETAYGDYVPGDGRDALDPSGKPVKVWRGEFVDRETGQPYTGAFTPRAPVGMGKMHDYVMDYMDRQIVPHFYAGGVKNMENYMGGREYERKMYGFQNMIEDDIPAFCKDDEEAYASIRRKDGEAILGGIISDFGKKFAEDHKHEFTAEDAEYMRRKSGDRPRGRDVSDMPDVEGEQDAGYEY